MVEAWSQRGGLPDSNSTAHLLGTSGSLTFQFDDNGWTSSLKLVNFSFTELGPGRVTVTAVPDNLTAWSLAESVTWYGVVPTVRGGFAEDDVDQSMVIHSIRALLSPMYVSCKAYDAALVAHGGPRIDCLQILTPIPGWPVFNPAVRTAHPSWLGPIKRRSVLAICQSSSGRYRLTDCLCF